MASVIRIKRRRTDDPAEALLLSHIKKSRITAEADSEQNVKSVLEFAGTLDSKEESVSKHIKEAIRRKKIHKQMHPHSSEFKLPHDRNDVTNKIRQQKAESSLNKRYRIKCSRRALDIDKLDNNEKDVKHDDNVNEHGGISSHHSHQDKNRSKSRLSPDDENKENSNRLSETSDDSSTSVQSSQGASALSGEQSTSVSATTKHGNEAGGGKVPNGACSDGGGEGKEKEKIYCLIDVEHEKQLECEKETTGAAAVASDVITVNGIPMKTVNPSSSPSSATSSTKVPIMDESDDYVYDLYYTHTRLADIQDDETVLTVAALCNEYLHDERADEGEEFVYDDDDDSNDEGNWRNDYPDEDPRFFENEGRDYDFENDMRESNFNGDDEGDLLSYWMDTRCRIDVDCNDFTGDDFARDGSSSDEEAGAEMGYY